MTSYKLKRLLKASDGKVRADRCSIGKRVEAATLQVFGESISDNAVAIKYSELLQAQRDSLDHASTNEYWRTSDFVGHGIGATGVVSHGLVKEQAVPREEINRAAARKKRFEANPSRHTYHEA